MILKIHFLGKGDVMMNANNESGKALVLSGGGITGIAWELGILRGLEECGVDVTDANLIIGTSAGSIVGAQIISDTSLEELYKLQLIPIEESKERQVQFNRTEFQKIMAAAIMSSPDSQTARARIGEASLASTTMTEEERQKIIDSRLPNHEWNQKKKLIINAVNASTGKWVTFEENSNVSLVKAVAASSAVPGIYPPTRINGEYYIDGSMSSGTNADLAKGYNKVLILVAEANMTHTVMGPTMHRINFNEELKILKESRAKVKVIIPDENSLKAKGKNPLDVNSRAASAKAGLKQGKILAEEVNIFWK